ncbi:hypothetical protein M408DRAFT_72881 [Serendipita vermifera MAFF 305830]|uniref:CHAT domain-containing protein n=1 Tax=Serendipita vermifera MAFF 305830 TaxID=933852 RepID=A0A0C2WIN6_SERVB|nr:hypothetical protein M408DRAFT_72881 [Serendipita vermifera MAFF 305830]
MPSLSLNYVSSAYNLLNAIKLAPMGHPIRPLLMKSLGDVLLDRFRSFGEVDDCDGAVSSYQTAVDLTSNDHPSKLSVLIGLGDALLERFEETSELSDCEISIRMYSSAIESMPTGHPDMHFVLSKLADAFWARFHENKEIEDCSKAIQIYEDVLVLLPMGHVHRPSALNDLAMSFQSRFEHEESLSDLEKAILYRQAAIELTRDGNPDKPIMLNSLGDAFSSKYGVTHDSADYEAAISKYGAAVGLAPNDDPERPSMLNDLAMSLLDRFERSNDRIDYLERAALEYSNSAQSTIGPYPIRFFAATSWARCEAQLSNPSSSLTAYSRALYLLPRVAWKGKPMGDRYNELARMGILVREAVAAAISAGKLELALEWLEQGRSIVWRQVLQLRTPLDELQALYPELAKALKRISNGLEKNAGYTSSSNIDELIGMEERGRKYRDLTREWEQTVDQVRSKPEFENFLRPRTLAKLSSALRDGPIVVLNVHQNRCDALIFVKNTTSESPTVLHVPLDGLLQHVGQLHHDINRLASTFRTQRSPERASIRVREREDDESRMKSILAVLWECVAQPVLKKLELPARPKKLPRIWWCATGALAFLPIHAAGLYDTDTVGSKLSDYVVSSYTPTVTALLERSNAVKDQNFGLLAVLQPSTPNAEPLPNTEEEWARIQKHIGVLPAISLVGLEGTVTKVLQAMKSSSWLHLACHGVQNVHKSAFLLEDGPLELSEIVKEDFPNAEFAFLSACQTSAGDKKLSEEAVHLAAGMLLSGYRSVVATMWSIRDQDAPFVADVVYAHLLKDGQPDYSRAASALHDAVQKLSQQPGVSLLSWVPFIHMGH